LQPDNLVVRNNLAGLYVSQGKWSDAVAEWREVLDRQADHLAALNGTAWILATASDPSVRNGAEAVDLARRAARLTGRRDPSVLDSLAAALAEAGRFSDAVGDAGEAATLASRQGKKTLAEAIRARQDRYRTHAAFRAPLQTANEVKIQH
jgi:Flp pilus assembly protein TadD